MNGSGRTIAVTSVEAPGTAVLGLVAQKNFNESGSGLTSYGQKVSL